MTEYANWVGQTIKNYIIGDMLGQSSFGAVYKAREIVGERDVVIKVISSDFTHTPQFARRFAIESQRVAQLESAYIVPLYDYWRDQHGAFIVTQHVRGDNLETLLKMGYWPLRDIARLVDQLAVSLDTAHRRGVVHGGLKPTNILLDADKNVHLTDFGMATYTTHANQAFPEDQALHYIAPEQLTFEAISPQTDIYNLGFILYALLTGEPPFAGSDPLTCVTKHLLGELPHLSALRPDLPADLNYVFQRATEKNPQDRYDNVMELAQALRDALDEMGEMVLRELDQRASTAFDVSELSSGVVSEFVTEPQNPYKGLQAFQEVDACEFFGRDEFIERLTMRLSGSGVQSRFIAVVGAMGSGKSSIIKAGLLPQIRQGVITNSDSWFIVDTTPTDSIESALFSIAVRPFDDVLHQAKDSEQWLKNSIDKVLPDDASELLILIDQFEQIFTHDYDDESRRLLLDGIADAVHDANIRVRVIITLRADFYDRLLDHPLFAPMMPDCTLILEPLVSQACTDAIRRPAEQCRLEFEPELIDVLTADEPHVLPLLQYAMTELYNKREGQTLTLDAYNAIGGVAVALNHCATDIYTGFDDAMQTIVRRLFLQMITLGEGSKDHSRRVLHTDMLAIDADVEAVQHVVDVFVARRLLTIDRDPITRQLRVGIAHDILLQEWSLLRSWIDANRAGLQTQRRVHRASVEWQNMGHDVQYLSSGMVLAQFEQWMSSTDLLVTSFERDYIEQSISERERLEAEARQRQADEDARHAQALQRLRRLLMITTGAACFAIVVMGLALMQSVRATQYQQDAQSRERIALTQGAAVDTDAQQVQSRALVTSSRLALAMDKPDLALLLALEASQIQQNNQTLQMLAEAAYAPGTKTLLQHDNAVNALAYSPDGMTLLTGTQDHQLRLWDVESGALIREFVGHDGAIMDIVFSSDGQQAVTGALDGAIILWDVQSGEELKRFVAANGDVRGVDMSRDGARILAGGRLQMTLWDVETGETLMTFDDGLSSITDVDLSPSANTVLSGFADGRIVLWSVSSGQSLLTYDAGVGGHTDAVLSVAYAADESGFLSAGQDNQVLLWRFEDGIPVQSFYGHQAPVTSAQFSPDGSQVITGSEDDAVIIWDANTGVQLQRFLGHAASVYDVAYNPVRAEVASASWDGSVRIWERDHGALLQMFSGVHRGNVNDMTLSSDGLSIVTAGDDMRLVVRDVVTGDVMRVLEGHPSALNAVEFSADGRQMASAGDDGTLALWDVETGDLRALWGGHSDAVLDVVYHPAGTVIASASRDNTIILWDATSGDMIHQLAGHTSPVTSVAFSPDGAYLVSSSLDHTLRLWDAATGEEQRILEGHTAGVLDVAWSPDGRVLASASIDYAAMLWDVETGRLLQRFEGHTAPITSVMFSPDGRYLLSGGEDHIAILWHVETGDEIQKFTTRANVYSLAFMPDSQQILSLSADGSIQVWQLRLGYDALLDWLEVNRYMRELTCTEREHFGVKPLCEGLNVTAMP
jgi:WD40 repeat protein/serine/threonine protein kinase